MKKTFIISDEQVNNYGFRVLTEGIDTKQYEKNPVVLYMHNRNTYSPKGNEVIGRAVKVYKKDGKLLADIEFDVEEKFAKQIAGKIERGFINMASPWLGVSAISEDSKLMLKGQTGATVTNSKLKEISIVDIGGNDGALKLFDTENNEIKLSDFSKNTISTKNQKMDYKSIALALGLNADAKEETILAKITENKTATTGLETKLADIETATKTAQKAEAVKLMDKASKLGLIPEALKAGQVKLFEADHEATKLAWETEIEKVENADPKEPEAKPETGSDMSKEAKLFLENLGKGTGATAVADKKLTDFTEDELKILKENKPKEFAKLVDSYVGTAY